MSYAQEDRVRTRSTIRRLNALANEAKAFTARGIEIPTAVEKAIYGLTNTEDRSRQIDALEAMAEKLRGEHLSRLFPLAKDDFNAFCEYVNPDEPPESKWHIFLTGILQKIETEPGHERFVLNCPPGHAKPLHVDTPILMANGSWKRLGDVEVGDKVITHLGRAQRVEAVHEQGTLDVFKITTKQGREIITAADHSFYVRKKRNGKLSAPTFRQACELRVGNLLTLPNAKIKKNSSGKSEAEFELAAYLAANGSRSYHQDRSKTRTYRNVFLITQDENLTAIMQSKLKKLDIEHTYWHSTYDNLHYIRLATHEGEKLADDYGIDLRSDERRVPAFVYKGGDAEVRRYIETYINCRGDIPNRFPLPRLHISFRSRAMASDFQRLLSRFGVPSAYVETGADTARLVLTYEHLSLYLQRFVYAGPNLSRIAQKAANFAHKKRYQGPFQPLDPISSIRSAGKAECRCLTVSGDHTFVANGVIVHNSTYASRLFVAWRMGRRPRDKIIGGGHSQRFVENEFSKKIRDLVRSPEYRAVFPGIVIDSSTSAKDQWALAGTGGQYVAKGVGQAVHGFRANFACVDDPYSKIEDAESPAIREKVKVWFFNDIGSRLLPSAIVFLVMTRFHEEDLTGAVIEANKNLSPRMRYEIVEAPALCYDPETDVLGRSLGEVLWNFYDHDYYADKKATWSYQRFSLVFQQYTDAVDETSIAAKFQFYRQPPHATEEAVRKAREEGRFNKDTGAVEVPKRDYYRRIVASVDTATKATERADFTVIQIWGENFDRKHYLLDQKRGKWPLPQMTREVNKLAKRHGVDVILVEDKGNGTSYIQEQGATEFQARKAPAPVVAIQVPSNQGKEFRFDEVTPMIEAREVFVPQDAPWIDLFLREVGQFPAGAKDDQVDAMSQYLRWAKTKRTRFGSKKVKSMG